MFLLAGSKATSDFNNFEAQGQDTRSMKSRTSATGRVHAPDAMTITAGL